MPCISLPLMRLIKPNYAVMSPIDRGCRLDAGGLIVRDIIAINQYVDVIGYCK
jgi:hypothetical protein